MLSVSGVVDGLPELLGLKKLAGSSALELATRGFRQGVRWDQEYMIHREGERFEEPSPDSLLKLPVTFPG